MHLQLVYTYPILLSTDFLITFLIALVGNTWETQRRKGFLWVVSMRGYSHGGRSHRWLVILYGNIEGENRQKGDQVVKPQSLSHSDPLPPLKLCLLSWFKCSVFSVCISFSLSFSCVCVWGGLFTPYCACRRWRISFRSLQGWSRDSGLQLCWQVPSPTESNHNSCAASRFSFIRKVENSLWLQISVMRLKWVSCECTDMSGFWLLCWS